MTVWKRTAQWLLASLTVLVTAAILLLALGFAELTPGFIPRPAIPLFLIVALGVPLAAGCWIAKVMGRRWQLGRIRDAVAPYRWLCRAVALAYLATVVFGIPATLSHQNAWAVAEYKRLRATGTSMVWDAHPYIHTYAALPVLPGLIISYHEYQLAGLYGAGTLELTVWYGAGVATIGGLPMWVS